MRALAAGNSCASVLDILSDMISADDGHLGRMIRNFSGKQKSRPLGVAGDEIFPLPLMFPSPLPRKGRSRLRTRRRNSLISHVNICIVAFNWLYAGKEGGSLLSPSAVQRRIHAVICEAVDSFLRSGSSASGEAEISGFLRESQHAYWTAGGHCLPLGLRAGVPEKAAVVDLHNILQKFDSALAKQIIHPGELLLPPRLRPRKLPRPFCKLDGTYGEYVKRNCKAGLQKLKPLKTIFKIKGKPLFSGAFAVAKNIEEDRAISALCPLNALVDQRKLWVPKFAIMSSMRAMTLARDKQLRVYKKDARHFFHFLRVGTRWHKYMAHPPLPSDGHHPQMYPVHQGVPMGFTAAAAWAQAYNEQKAREAELPVDSRLVDGKPPPSGFPIWGSILDDVWAIEEDPVDDHFKKGHNWLDGVSRLWAQDGVEEHKKKAVEGAKREEVQGAMVDGVAGWVGVSYQKRLSILEAGLHLIVQRRPLVGAVDRWVGKLSYALSFRACARSILQDIYTWLDVHRNRSKRAYLWPSVRSEMMMACILLPFMQIDLRAQWSARVECSDAAPGGHGRAWTSYPSGLVSEISRLCTNKGIYTNIRTEHGVELNEEGVCPLQQVRIPVDEYSWKTIGRPGGYKHITLEEAAALNWSLHDRLRRPQEFNSKVLHGVDSAAATGAYKKGRSASRSLNGFCRQACAIILCGNLEPFFAWIPTGLNPADEPSSRHGVRAGKVRTTLSEKEGRPIYPSSVATDPKPALVVNPSGDRSPVTSTLLQEHFIIRRWLDSGLVDVSDERAYNDKLPQIIVHLCSGPRRRHDYIYECIQRARENGVGCIGIRIDPLIDPSLDLLDGTVVTMLRALILEGRVRAIMCSPPCSTWSRARHQWLGKNGPRPLRSRAHPLQCLPFRSPKEEHACNLGSIIAAACVYLLGYAIGANCWNMLEHPRDPGHEPFPSIFTSPFATLLQQFGARSIYLDQCQYGAQARKPTQLLVGPRIDSLEGLQLRCNHSEGHIPHIGRYPDGTFMTTSLSKYPSPLCKALSVSAWDWSPRPLAPKRVLHVCQAWEQAWQSANFPFEHPAGQKSHSLHTGSRRFQN